MKKGLRVTIHPKFRATAREVGLDPERAYTIKQIVSWRGALFYVLREVKGPYNVPLNAYLFETVELTMPVSRFQAIWSTVVKRVVTAAFFGRRFLRLGNKYRSLTKTKVENQIFSMILHNIILNV
jgi:hypothetical protein